MGHLAYVVHSSKYSETSVLLDLFVRGEGISRVLHRGAKRKKQAPLQSGVCYQIERVGKQGLKTLVSAEPVGAVTPIYGEQQYLLFYLNELNIRLTRDTDLSERLFDQYQAIVDALRQALNVEPYLREYELTLFSEIGYGAAILRDASNIVDEQHYGLTPSGDIVVIGGSKPTLTQPVIAGHVLRAIATTNWQVEYALGFAKLLTRTMVDIRLGGRPLKSRELFKQYKEATSE